MIRTLVRTCMTLAALVGLVAHGDDAALRQRVETEFPLAMAKLEARYDSMHGRAIYHKTICRPGGKPCVEELLQLDFAFAPGLARLATTDLKPVDVANAKLKIPIESVHGVNREYGFMMTRNQPDADYHVRNIGSDLRQARSTIRSRHGSEIQCGATFGLGKLSEIFAVKAFRLDSVAEVEGAAGSKQVLIRYISTRDFKTLKPNAISIDGWIVVTPDDGWIIREYGVVQTGHTVGGSQTHLGKIEYARSADGHLDPVRLVDHYCPGRIERAAPEPPHDGSVSFELTFESVKYEALPEADFHLPAFGLPEAEAPAK